MLGLNIFHSSVAANYLKAENQKHQKVKGQTEQRSKKCFLLIVSCQNMDIAPKLSKYNPLQLPGK